MLYPLLYFKKILKKGYEKIEFEQYTIGQTIFILILITLVEEAILTFHGLTTKGF